MCSVNCAVSTGQSTLSTLQCVFLVLFYSMVSMQCILCSVYYAVCNVLCAVFSVVKHVMGESRGRCGDWFLSTGGKI